MTVKDMSQELTEHRFFTHLAPKLIEQLANCSNNVVFRAGESILAEGHEADRFFAIRSGRVCVGIRAPQGLQELETLRAGDILGWSWLFPPYQWHFDAEAIEPVRAIELHAPCIREYVEAHPREGFDLVASIAGVMEERLDSARMRLLDVFKAGRNGPAD